MNNSNSSKASERNMTAGQDPECRCGGPPRIADQHETSVTVYCPNCDRYLLVVGWPDNHQVIPLADFHLKRGYEPDQRPLNDLSMATRLVRCLTDNTWPTPATVMDFGIESEAHFGALQHAVRCGRTAYDLDRVMGDGPAITQIVRSVPNQPYASVEFRTAFDDMAELMKEPE